MAPGLDALTPRQRQLVTQWLPDGVLVRDHSWGLIGTTVLEMTAAGGRYLVKAGDARDHHLAREVRAHREWVAPWVATGRAPRLLRADDEAKILLREFLDGHLVEDSPAERDPAIYHQAGRLLAELHGQRGRDDAHYEAAANARTLAWLDGPHRIAPSVVARLRATIAEWPTPVAFVVPTHGDWQPRNWLVDHGVVRVIDFGRADERPALTDFARLAAQQFVGGPELEAAFVAGYGADPREPDAWHRQRVREAVGTAAWACLVGADDFERQGLRMIDDALDDASLGRD